MSFLNCHYSPEKESSPSTQKLFIADRLRISRLVGDEKASCDYVVGGADTYGNKTTLLPRAKSKCPVLLARGLFYGERFVNIFRRETEDIKTIMKKPEAVMPIYINISPMLKTAFVTEG